MTDTKAPDQGLKEGADGRMHTAQCVDEGWDLLDWDVDCVHVGVPAGGHMAALGERALFSTAITLLPIAAGVVRVVQGVRRGR